MLGHIANKALSPLGLKLVGRDQAIYPMKASWFRNPEFLAALDAFPGAPNPIHDRRFNLYFMAKAFAHIPGALAECGVCYGRSVHFLLSASADKHLYGFDSFEGLSRPEAIDGGGWATGDLSSAEQIATANLQSHAGRFTLYKGWIPDRFKEVADKSFSFVHVDVDLYQPTLDSLEFFWPRLSPGGILLCDDYGSTRCPGARKAMDEFAASVGQQVAELSTRQAFLIKPCSHDRPA